LCGLLGFRRRHVKRLDISGVQPREHKKNPYRQISRSQEWGQKTGGRSEESRYANGGAVKR